MTAVLGFSKADLEAYVDARTDQKHFQHEVVKSVHEEGTEGGPRRHILLVRTEMVLTNV